MGPIPAKSTLSMPPHPFTTSYTNHEKVFETELIGIKGVQAPEEIIEKSASSIADEASEGASSVADKATDGVKAAAASKIAEAVEALKVTLADTDGDGQEHNEL